MTAATHLAPPADDGHAGANLWLLVQDLSAFVGIAALFYAPWAFILLE